MEIIVDNASYPTDKIGRELARFPASRSRLRQPRRPADGARPALRLGRRARLRGGDHRPHVRRRLRPVGAHRRGAGTVRRLRRQSRTDAAASCASIARRLRRIDSAHVPLDLLQAAKRSWDDVVELGERHGLRNSQISVLAPTGTIAFMMDCDTTGVEPDIALVKYKKLVGGGMIKIVNQTVPLALRGWATRPNRSGRSSSTSTRTTPSKARRSCSTSTCRFSTARSGPLAARARSTTSVT